MALDYGDFVATAQELIADAGRTCTFKVMSATPVDPSKPWNGPSAPTAASTLSTYAAFVPASGSGLGKDVMEDMLLHRAEQVCLVAPAAADPAFDFSACHLVDDGGVSWRVVNAHVLRPGATAVLYALGLAR